MKAHAMYFLFIVPLIFCQSSQPTFKEDMEKLFVNIFEENEPGGSILVKKGEDIMFLKNYGLADLETKEKITENTIFNTGSISKTFVANGILLLQERELLSVEDNLAEHFEDFDYPEIAVKVKLKHLLSHSSGLPDSRKVSENIDFFMTAKDKENFAPLKKTKSLKFEPGERFEYSNPAFNGLALIIENLSGQKWQDFIIKNIFSPAVMNHSKITDGSYPQSEVAHAYNPEGEGFAESDYGEFPTFTAAGNGGVWCSVLDLAKYEQALNNYRILNKETLDNSRTILQFENWKDDVDPFLGYGWFLGEKSLFGTDSDLEVKIVYHTGSQGGFRAFYISIPDKDILYVALFNRPFDEYRTVMKEGVSLMKGYNWLE